MVKYLRNNKKKTYQFLVLLAHYIYADFDLNFHESKPFRIVRMNQIRDSGTDLPENRKRIEN